MKLIIEETETVKTYIESFGEVYQLIQKFDEDEEESVIILDKESIKKIHNLILGAE